MKTTLIAAGLAIGLLAACGSDSDPQTLRVLGVSGAGSGDATSLAAPEVASDMRIGGAVRYEVDGELPELDDQAPAWELAVERLDEDRVLELAELLGVDGRVKRTEYGWSVVGDDGAQLDVQRQAGLPWNRYESSPDEAVTSGVACAEPMPARDDVATSEEIQREKCVPEEPQRPEGMPSKADAEEQGRELMESLGVDLDDADVRVEDGFSVWNVMADPEVGGLPVIGMTSSVAIGPKGEVQYANGWLGQPEEGDEYPLIGTKAALKKLRDEQVSILGGGPEPMIARCDPAADCVDDAPVMEPTTVHITDVHLGLQLFGSWDQEAPAYLVPSYLFETDDGGELPVIAVEEEFLAPPPEPEPAPEPGGGSGGSSGSCSGSGSSDGESVQVCGPDRVALGDVATWTVKATCGDDLVADFGDGTPEDTVPSGEVSHRYEKAGAYEVSFRATACDASVTTKVEIGEHGGDPDEPAPDTDPGSEPNSGGTPTQIAPVPPDDPNSSR